MDLGLSISLSFFSGEAIWTWWFSRHSKSYSPKPPETSGLWHAMIKVCGYFFFTTQTQTNQGGALWQCCRGLLLYMIPDIHTNGHHCLCGQMKLCHQLEIATSWKNGRIAHINLLINKILQSSQHTCYLIRHGFAMFSCHNHCLKSLKMLSNQQYQQKTHITTIRSTHRVPNRCWPTGKILQGALQPKRIRQDHTKLHRMAT